MKAQHPFALRRAAAFERQENVLQPQPARGRFRQFGRSDRLLAAQVDDGAQAVAARDPLKPRRRRMIRAIQAARNDLVTVVPENTEVSVIAQQAFEPEPPFVRGQICRSRIRPLISPIALPGFNPFGHVIVQFMIVWQRYSL